uniref:Glycosyltransferase RgtA/B/C/D-like domain-containing protein n=1 Tax=candidate division WOR-3 bacterium TaxID=2052148 RepID=A0A7C3YU42_UNCW3
MNRKNFYLLFLVFSIIFILPVWLFPFLPFVDLPQHLNFAYVLRHYSSYQAIYSLRLFPMHNTLHLFFTYLFSFLFPLEISNKIYVTLSLLLIPLSLLFFLKSIGANEYFSLLGFLLSYNYNLFWGFMGINLGTALILFLIGYEVRYLKGERRIKYLFLSAFLFFLLFLAHSLFYLFAFFTFFLLFLFIPAKKKVPLLLPLISVFFITFLPWQISQFRGEGSELEMQFREYISPSALYSNLWEFFRRVGVKTDESYIFILKIIFLLSLFTTGYLIYKKGFSFLFSTFSYRSLLIFSFSAFLFYAFFPGMYTEAVFLNERFACLLFLLVIAYLALNWKDFSPRFLPYLLSFIISFVGLDIGLRIALFNREAKPVKELLGQLPEGRKLAGLIYQKRPKADLFGYDCFLHFPAYYAIWKKGLVGFTFGYIRYSPIIYRDDYPLPRIDEWETWHSVFPEGYENYDYFLVAGEPRLSDLVIIERWHLLAKKGIWSLYEVPKELKRD